MVDITALKQTGSDELSRVDDLYSYLHIDKTNAEIYLQSKKNLEQLLKLYNRTSMVSFIGAGTSKPLNISDWETLMKNLCAQAKSQGFTRELPYPPKEWPQFAQDIYDHLKERGNSDIYFDTILQNMLPKNNTTTLTLVKMVLALDVHLTTNFDNSLQKAYEFLNYLFRYFNMSTLQKKYRINYLPDFKAHQKMDDSLIYYLHGNIDRKVYILKQSDYDKFYPSISRLGDTVESLEIFLKGHYKYSNIIFIGFSFDDDYFRKFFFKLAKESQREDRTIGKFYNESNQLYEQEDIKHFLIIDAGVLNKHGESMHRDFQTFNIYPVIYKDGEHLFLEELFESLSKTGKIYE